MIPRLSGRDIYLVGLFFLFLSFRRRLRLRRGPGNDCRPCLGPVALKGAGPRSSAWCNGTHQRKETTQSSASRLYHRSFPTDHARTHNEHPPRLVGHFASLASDSRDGRHVIASSVARPRRAQDAEDDARVLRGAPPSPAKRNARRLEILRGRSAALFRVATAIAPSRAAVLALLRAALETLAPLTARLSAALPISSVGGATTPPTGRILRAVTNGSYGQILRVGRAGTNRNVLPRVPRRERSRTDRVLAVLQVPR